MCYKPYDGAPAEVIPITDTWLRFFKITLHSIAGRNDAPFRATISNNFKDFTQWRIYSLGSTARSTAACSSARVSFKNVPVPLSTAARYFSFVALR